MITSRQNPLVKDLRQLHRSKTRRQQQCLLLEGTHLLEIALQQGYPLEVLCYTEAWQAKYPNLAATAQRQAARPETVSEAVLGTIATTVHPDGVVATLDDHYLPRQAASPLRLGLLLAAIQDPGNVGTMMRTAAAAGADGVWLGPGTAAVDHPKVLRASAGMALRFPVIPATELGETIAEFRQQGVAIVATTMTADCAYWDWDWRSPTVIVMGNEGAGLSPEVQALADGQVSIPQTPGVESLNVAIAAGLLLYEAQRQRRNPR